MSRGVYPGVSVGGGGGGGTCPGGVGCPVTIPVVTTPYIVYLIIV